VHAVSKNTDVLRFGHTESGLPRREGVPTVLCKIASSPSNRRRAAVCARGGKAFGLYYVRLNHPHQTEGGLKRRTFVF
jgi:hypothetical protein